MSVIEATDIGVRFRKYRSRRRRLRAWLLRKEERQASEFWALRGVTFRVEEGEVLGVIGPNGAGKSTLLRVIAGIYRPDEGELRVRGKVSPLLTLGAGFRPDLTGRDNIYLNGVLLGLSRREVDARVDEIVSFAELKDFIDQPVRTYSSGMTARLGFAIATSLEPDILLIDEVLGVGDERFRRKSEDRMREFLHKAKAIVVVTHSMGFIRKFCTRALWVERGRVRLMGDPESVVAHYLREGRPRPTAEQVASRRS